MQRPQPMSAFAVPLRVLAPSPGRGRAAPVITLLLFALGTSLASAAVLSFGLLTFAFFVALITTVAAVWILPHEWRRLRKIAGTMLVLLHLGWLGLAAALMSVLAWSVPTWMWVIEGLVTAVALAGAISARVSVRVPVALPVGIAIAVLMSGWMREDGVIRCDDYLRVRAASISVVVPSTPELEHCAPGDSLSIRRYPRQVWEAPDGSRFVFTTQRGDHDWSPRTAQGRRVLDWFEGAVCEARPGSGDAPRCMGDGKGHGIAESPRRDRLYVVSHGPDDGTVYAFPEPGPFQPLLETKVAAKGGLFYVDEERDVLGIYEDSGQYVYLLRAADMSTVAVVPAPFLPDAAHYDQGQHEGIVCAGLGPLRRIDGNAYVSVAFTGDPFTFRPLAPSSRYPSSWLAATWACDWDPAARRAYVGVASLGLLEEIDYDSGDIVRRSFIWPGVRSIVVDTERRRIYAGFFLSGDIVAIDMASRAVVARWPAGRFVRQVVLSRDKQSLFVTSNLGVVRIPLGAPAAPTADRQ